MKYIKLFESFGIIRSPKYKKPEYEFKEFYRAFRNYTELRELLPSNIDHEILDIEGDGFAGEPEWLDAHVDPPSRLGDITTDELIKVAEEKDPRFIPLIIWCKELFKNGGMEKISLDYMRPRLTSNFKNHDWGILEKDPNYLDNCEAEYNKAIKLGLNDETLNTTGLVQKYPSLNIPLTAFWRYVKGSIAHFNKVKESGDKLPCTQFILYNGNYYTIGGRRRMFWHFYNKIDPTVWVINI